MVILLVFNLLLTVFRILYVLYYPLDLSPEEAQYWDWSRDLDLSYYSKPPMVAYLNFVSTSLLGNTELAVRITPILLSFLLSLLTYAFVKRVFDEKTALISATLPQLSVGFAINSLLMTTDAPFVFFWSLSVMCIYLAVERNSPKLWLLAGALAGLAFLSKYPAVFLLPLTLLYLLLTKRELLKDKKPYLSLIPSTLLVLPVLYWNYKHDFVSFKHVSTLAVKDQSLLNLHSFLEYLGGQALLLSVIPFFLLLYAWYKSIKDRKLLFFTVYSFFPFLFFLVLSLRKEVYANWSGFAYFTGFILVSVLISKRTWIATASYMLSFILFVLLHFTPLVDRLGLTQLLPPRRDPLKELVGWEELGREVSRIYTGRELILSPRYQISAELAFYVEGNPLTDCINLGRRMNQYDLWKGRIRHMLGSDAIYVDYSPIHEKVLKTSEGIIHFEELPIYWRGEEVKRFYVYKLKNYRGTEERLPMGY